MWFVKVCNVEEIELFKSKFVDLKKLVEVYKKEIVERDNIIEWLRGELVYVIFDKDNIFVEVNWLRIENDVVNEENKVF